VEPLPIGAERSGGGGGGEEWQKIWLGFCRCAEFLCFVVEPTTLQTIIQNRSI